MEKEDLRKLVKERLDENLYKHSLAVEAVMRELALVLNENEEDFALAGLLHDIDLDATKDKPHLHSIVGAEFLKSIGIKENIVEAVKKHNPIHNLTRETAIEKALYCSDPLTGLITACALVSGRDLNKVTVDFVLKRFKEKRFAAGANREAIASCSELGLSLEKFVEIGLNGMRKIKSDLGL